MEVNEMKGCDGYPEMESIARIQANLAAIKRVRREREEATKRRILELGEIDLYQSKDFRD